MSPTRVLIAAGILLLGNTTRASERAAGERTVGEALLEGVVVEVDPEVPDAELTKTWVEERARDVVASLDPPLADGDLVRVVVTGMPYEYRISLSLSQGKVSLSADEQPEPIACSCGSDEMLDRVAQAIIAGAETIAEVAERRRKNQALAEAEAQIAREKAYRQRRDAALAQQDTSYEPTAVGYVGIAFLGVGSMVTISGVAVVAQGDEHKAGLAIVGAGLATMTGALTMLVVDVVRCRRDRSRCHGAAWTPVAGCWASRSQGGWR